MDFQPLYKKNKNGRWQQYIIKVIEKDNKILIEKSSGLIGGKNLLVDQLVQMNIN
jgi:hypothetical protein